MGGGREYIVFTPPRTSKGKIEFQKGVLEIRIFPLNN
jgi:hypothetical protein